MKYQNILICWVKNIIHEINIGKYHTYVVKEYENGFYDAKISIPNPKAFKDPNAKSFLEKEGREKISLKRS